MSLQPRSSLFLRVAAVLGLLCSALAPGSWYCLDGRVCSSCTAPAAPDGAAACGPETTCASPGPGLAAVASDLPECRTCCRHRTGDDGEPWRTAHGRLDLAAGLLPVAPAVGCRVDRGVPLSPSTDNPLPDSRFPILTPPRGPPALG